MGERGGRRCRPAQVLLDPCLWNVPLALAWAVVDVQAPRLRPEGLHFGPFSEEYTSFD